MRGQIAKWIAGLILSLAGVSAFAQHIDRETIDRTFDDQQRVQAQTTELLASVLDVQLRQLQENGLTEHEIFRDVQLMRRNLQNLVESDMQRVVDTLRNTRNLPAEQRDEAFKNARLQIRHVVRQLTLERHLLLQRLKIFELADQVQKLVDLQAVVQTSTMQLIGRDTSSDQAALTLKAIEDQRDIHGLFQHLIETLHDMKSRRGPSAVIAADGLRLLNVLELDQHVGKAGRSLQTIQLESANESQSLVIKGLKELLKLIGRAQGTIDTENTTAPEIVRALMDRQKQLRDQTKLLTEQQAPPAELIEQQAQLQGSIARLQDHIATFAKADAHRQQAEAAVFDAASNLLENKLVKAVADQGRVLGNLAALERAISENATSLSRDLSADDLSQAVKMLEDIHKTLAGAIGKSDDSGTEIAQSTSAEILDEIRALVRSHDERRHWPDFVRVALSEATDILNSNTVNSSDRLPADKVEWNGGQENKTELKSALRQARTTIDRGLIESRRLGLAIRIGELTRSAEVLERTAAEQRSIVKETVGLMNGGQAAMTDGIRRAGELSMRQGDIASVADRIATALTNLAPASAKSISDDSLRARRLKESHILTMAVTSPNEIRRSMETAVSIAQSFANSAHELRQQIVIAAEDLTQLSTEQSDRLSELRTAVESAVDQMPAQDMPIELERVRQDLDRAIQEQVRAQGRYRMADAINATRLIQEALTAQEIVNAALDINSPFGNSDLKTTTVQAEVAEKSLAAASAVKALQQTGSPDELERISQILTSLTEAEQAAIHSAKQILAGDIAAAKVSRATIQSTLRFAMALAEQIVALTMKDDVRGSLDRQAQTDAAKSVIAAQKRLVAIFGEADDLLIDASSAVADSTEFLSTDAPHTAEAQKKALTELTQARTALDQMILQRLATHSQQIVQQSARNREVAARVEVAEPSAAAAIRETSVTTHQTTQASQSARHIAAEIGRVTMGLEQAVAELSAREQDLRHDLAIAESVKKSITRQQSATTTIAEQASELERLTMASRDETLVAAQRAAAQKLNDARRRFVESQRATGQAAVELSGQIEVANPSLREALELAARFVGTEQGTNSPDSASELQSASAGSEDPIGTPQQQDERVSQPADDNGVPSVEKEGNERRERSKSRGASAGKKPNGLGTGFVSQSPDVTAEMMAGTDAIHAAKQALAAQLPPSQQSDADAKTQPESSNDTEQNETESSESGRSSKLAKGSNAGGVNQKVKEGMINQQPEGTEAKGQTSGESRQTDENVSSKALKEETWFAKLPPELRKSLRAGIGQKGPRTYEDRLKKYFQSTD